MSRNVWRKVVTQAQQVVAVEPARVADEVLRQKSLSGVKSATSSTHRPGLMRFVGAREPRGCSSDSPALESLAEARVASQLGQWRLMQR